MVAVAVVVLALVTLLLAVPAPAQIDEGDVEAARQRMISTQARLDEMGAEWEAAVARSAVLEEQVEQMTAALRSNEEQLAELEKDVDRYALELYMGSAGSSARCCPSPPHRTSAEAGLEYLEDVGASDDQLIRDLEAAQARQTEPPPIWRPPRSRPKLRPNWRRSSPPCRRNSSPPRTTTSRVRPTSRRRSRRNNAARPRSSGGERKRSASAAAAQGDDGSDPGDDSSGAGGEPPATEPPPRSPTIGNGSGYCPVQGPHTFGDGWGAPRGGGRYHSGIDLVAATGTPLVAVYDGYVERADYSGLGGNQIYYRDHAGNVYYYAHLNGYAAGIGSGVRLSAGDLVGYVGSTGNSSGPHLHFSYGPGGGGFVDPYGLVMSLCR